MLFLLGEQYHDAVEECLQLEVLTEEASGSHPLPNRGRAFNIWLQFTVSSCRCIC